MIVKEWTKFAASYFYQHLLISTSSTSSFSLLSTTFPDVSKNTFQDPVKAIASHGMFSTLHYYYHMLTIQISLKRNVSPITLNMLSIILCHHN